MDDLARVRSVQSALEVVGSALAACDPFDPLTSEQRGERDTVHPNAAGTTFASVAAALAGNRDWLPTGKASVIHGGLH